MKVKRTAGLAVVVMASWFWVGCGETFRPVATPIPQPGGDPQAFAQAIVLNDNGGNLGTAENFDVSGDSIASIVTVGRNPVHAGVVTGGVAVYVANRGDDSITVYSALTPSAPNPFIVSLPLGAAPVFAAASPSGGAVYVAESYPAQAAGKVGVIFTSVVSLHAEIPVGKNPVALVVSADGTKLYCLNKDDGTVTVIAAADDTVITTIAVGGSPVWAVLSADGTRVFVVNQGLSQVQVISTTSDTVTGAINVGAGPNYAIFDRSLKRVYVTSPAGNSLSIINPDTSAVATVSVTGAPCSGSSPVSVTALRDGTRAYVANSGSNNVCVLNTTNNTFTRSIAAGTMPVGIASPSDSSKVFVANAGGGTPTNPGTITDIRTSDDTVVFNLPAPKADSTCVDPAAPNPPTCARQSPRFVTVIP